MITAGFKRLVSNFIARFKCLIQNGFHWNR
jgi:hypothetical protein